MLPVIEALASRVAVPISIDTYKAATADAALILMHTRGRSRDMYAQASYLDVVDEVRDELRESMAFATGAGVAADRIMLDPGLGFAKEAPHSGLDGGARLGASAQPR